MEGKEEKMKRPFIPVITRGASAKILLDEILYIENSNRKLKIVTTEEEYLVAGRMDRVRDYLDERFMFCMCGCCVNIEQIRSIQGARILFRGDKCLMLGRDTALNFRRVFNQYLMGECQKFGGLPRDGEEKAYPVNISCNSRHAGI